MTRSEFIERLAELQPQLSRTDIDVAVHTLLSQVSDALANGDRVEVRGFGAFSLKHLPPRKGRNPKTGESVDVPEKSRVHFKPGKELRERVHSTHQRQRFPSTPN